MRIEIKNIIILFFSGLLLPAFYCAADAGAGDAGSAAGQEETRSYIRKLEQRISDLEGIVKRLLDDKKAGSAVSSQQSTVPETAVEEKKDKASSAAGKDEWDEPVVQKEPAKGRDEEARRRLTELETWKRKAEARAAKDAEETAERPKIEISGKYKLRLNSRSNLNLDNPFQFWQFDNKAYFDQRFQLKIDAEYGPLTSVLILDKGNFVFDWKEGSEGTLDRWSEFQTVTPALVRELYVQYTGNVIIKAGRHSLFVGNGGIILEGPVDSLKVTYPVGQTPLGRVSATAAYIAVAGGWRSYNDFRYPSGDRSAVLGMANKLDGWLLSLDIKPQKDITIEPYLLKVFDRGRPGDPDLNLDKDFDANTLPRDGSFEPIWIGAAISGKNNNISYKADLIYMTGAYTNTRDTSAYAVMLRGDYKFRRLGPLREFSAGLEFGRGSGNSAEERVSGSGDMKDFIGLFLCKERRKFGNIFSEDLRAGFFFGDSNLSNITFMRAIADFEPTKNLKTNISLARFWTTESVYKGRGPVGDWSMGKSVILEKTRDIGWEIDANFDFPIYKRLRGFAEFGYFVPGDAYQKTDGSRADPASEVVLGAEFEF